MCPKVDDEASPGEETSPSCRAVVGRCRAGGAGGSGLACTSLLLGLEGLALFHCVAPLLMRLRQQGLSEASDSQDSVLMLKSFRESLRLSLMRFR